MPSKSVSGPDHARVGISAMSIYVPRLRVDLERWCAWTGQDWDKVAAVTGRGFRMCGLHEDVYTMAANAVLRLIVDNEIDPGRIGYFALGTESSTDNAVGAVSVLGMVNRELLRRGLRGFGREVEVPEFKHACLGGMYAVLGGARYTLCAPEGRQAIVVAADVAEYERGSSVEQMQAAGAVAMLVERPAALLALDLERTAGASADRGPDFRKPVARHRLPGYAPHTQRLSDFPVLSGRYSTAAYTDAVTCAVEALWARCGGEPLKQLQDVRALFLHRPYRRMPLQAASFLYVRALAASASGQEELERLCREGGIEPDGVMTELGTRPDLRAAVLAGEHAPDPYPATTAAAGRLRKTAAFAAFCQERMSLGGHLVDEVGNIYTAALPAWLAAALETAVAREADLAGAPMLAVGYGSGDAALALPCTLVEGWQHAARRIGFARALQHPVDLDREQYELLHDRRQLPRLQLHPLDEFVINKVGDTHGRDFQDLAVPYYGYAC